MDLDFLYYRGQEDILNNVWNKILVKLLIPMSLNLELLFLCCLVHRLTDR